MKPLIYIAGPYTNPDPVENTHTTIQVAAKLLDAGQCTPVVPHLSLLFHLVTPRPYHVWLDYDIEIMLRCDAVLRLPGASSGADGEIKVALENDIPVFTTLDGLDAWLDHQLAGV